MEMFAPPPAKCRLCPRLAQFREANERKFPTFYNGAVPSFGPLDAEFLVVGLAPGLKGANATGRPFTGDYAGDVLYASLKKFGFAEGTFKKRADDGFTLKNVRITNAVRCVPPENKPTPEEARTCNSFLVKEIGAMKRLKLILTLGLTSHQSVLKTLKLKQKDYAFGHGRVFELNASLSLLSSYHTSRYNIQTGRLTQPMFDKVIMQAAELLKG